MAERHGADGRLVDLPELRLLEVRVEARLGEITETKYVTGERGGAVSVNAMELRGTGYPGSSHLHLFGQQAETRCMPTAIARQLVRDASTAIH